jgi:hypothetical protein
MEEKFKMDTTVALVEHDKEIESVKHRLQRVEEQMKVTQELAMSVNKLAVNMEHMLKEQKGQGKRLTLLEAEPGKQYKHLKTVIITALTTALIGGIVGAILTLL